MKREVFPPTHVPCNGCTLCCQNDAVRITVHDDVLSYRTEPHSYFPGERMLAHKDNGDCVYLTATGCGIYAQRPFMCRTADCRLIPLRISREHAKALSRSGSLQIKVWEKGLEMLRRYPLPHRERK